MKNTVIITQARTGSSRFPGKVLTKTTSGKTLLDLHLHRLLKCKNVTEIVVATTINEVDDKIVHGLNHNNILIFRGSEQNVLERYYFAAMGIKADIIVRVTSDCPLIDPILVDEVIKEFSNKNVDYISNTQNETYPDGQDIEVFSFKALEKCYFNATLKYHQEHVTPFIKENPKMFKIACFDSKINYNHIRMTVDVEDDLKVIDQLIDDLGEDASWTEYKDSYLRKELSKINGTQIRNEGLIKSIQNE